MISPCSYQDRSIIVIGGPTASGKSARAEQLAREHDGIIINADSIQVYDALPILTAREAPSLPHHYLSGAISVHDRYTVMRWLQDVYNIEQSTDRCLIICGGTGFYLQALIDGISPMPEIPQSIRAQGLALYHEWGAERFYEYVRLNDPHLPVHICASDTYRLLRAWEVFEYTKRPLSEWHQHPKHKIFPNARFSTELIMPPRQELYKRCDERFIRMIEHGVLDEVAAFSEQINETSVPIMKALGYCAIVSYLQGIIPYSDMITEVQIQTRHYAKRQMTWFKNCSLATHCIQLNHCVD